MRLASRGVLVDRKCGERLVRSYSLINEHAHGMYMRQTERQMVQICEGQKSKNDMMTENIEMYKDMYMRIKREMNRVITVSPSYSSNLPELTAHAERREPVTRSRH
jgi:DNA topoisomerase IA